MTGMKGLKKKRRVQIILVAFVGAGGEHGADRLCDAGRDQLLSARPRRSWPSRPTARETFRIGGLVEEGTLVRGQGETITFSVTDGGASVPVSYTGVLPDLFDEGQGMIGTGNLIDGYLRGDRDPGAP